MLKKKNGFTLIELIIALAIIAIMAGTLYPSLQAYRQHGIEQDMKNQEYLVNKALKQYYALTGRYPVLSEGVHFEPYASFNPALSPYPFRFTAAGEAEFRQELLAKTGIQADITTYYFYYKIDESNNPVTSEILISLK